jgi:hypothetical protein
VVETAEITPEPDEDEREAILAALDAEVAMRQAGSDWADALLPGADSESDPP